MKLWGEYGTLLLNILAHKVDPNLASIVAVTQKGVGEEIELKIVSHQWAAAFRETAEPRWIANFVGQFCSGESS